MEEYLQAAFTNRKDIAAIDYRKKAAETGIKTVKGEMYPGLALNRRLYSSRYPNVFSVTNAVNIGVGVSYNIGSLWKTKAKVQQAEAKVKQLAIDRINDR